MKDFDDTNFIQKPELTLNVPAELCFFCSLPFPPSDNHIHFLRTIRTKGGKNATMRGLTREGQNYLDTVVQEVLSADSYFFGKKFDREYIITFRYFLPDKRRRDLSNAGKKLINDGIEKATGINDSQFYNMDLPFTGYDRENPRVEIEMWDIGINPLLKGRNKN